MRIIGIAAVAKNGVMGIDSKLPWDIPEDMSFFRKTTREQIVVLGRKSFDAIVEVTGKPLPKRENAVITRNDRWSFPGVRVFQGLEQAIRFYRESPDFSQKDLYIIGGAEIFAMAFPVLDEMLLTEIDTEIEGNIFFPDYRDGVFLRSEFSKAESRPQEQEQGTGYRYFFNRYVRRSNS